MASTHSAAREARAEYAEYSQIDREEHLEDARLSRRCGVDSRPVRERKRDRTVPRLES